MQNLTDRDIAYDMLYGAKSCALTYMEAVLESASPRCREVFHHLLDDGLRGQWKLWNLLHDRNEYRTEPADRREVDSVRQHMEHLCQTHQEAVRTQFAAIGGRETESGRWNERERMGGSEHRWNEPGTGAYATGRYAGESGGAATTYSGTAAGYGNTGFGAGTYGTQGNGVNFEAGRNLPEGTRFDAERGFAGGSGNEGRRYSAGAATGGSWSESGAANREHGRYGSPTAGGRWNTGTIGRTDSQGGSWNTRNDRGSPVGIGARPAEGNPRNFGENTWTSEATRRSEPSANRS